ncbi:MAG: hypothetical protein OMM_05601 [Candidatus Magnetoglobus multicellularis str. Araruama]|uniref:Uncharacterized protein n=1 Tax=Candidatus Magnetoglobus multicellularis str. Araruama TaxID=890399 RepID=A0A1V1NVF5_9BACT|nr:MAG: hypothetical protein OMM_05601 [Candidatus Magnetoglobus multicellularis str. Araruama]
MWYRFAFLTRSCRQNDRFFHCHQQHRHHWQNFPIRPELYLQQYILTMIHYNKGFHYPLLQKQHWYPCKGSDPDGLLFQSFVQTMTNHYNEQSFLNYRRQKYHQKHSHQYHIKDLQYRCPFQPRMHHYNGLIFLIDIRQKHRLLHCPKFPKFHRIMVLFQVSRNCHHNAPSFLDTHHYKYSWRKAPKYRLNPLLFQ